MDVIFQHFKVHEKSGDQAFAGLLARCRESLRQSAPGERGHGGGDGLAEVDGLDLWWCFVESRLAEGTHEDLQGGEHGHPIDPEGETRWLRWPLVVSQSITSSSKRESYRSKRVETSSSASGSMTRFTAASDCPATPRIDH
jgi:hypothetical protein